MPAANLAELFFARARELAGHPRYRVRGADGWREVSWAEMERRVLAIAAGLLDMGVEPGDRVALLSAHARRVDGDRLRDPRLRRAHGAHLPLEPGRRVRLHHRQLRVVRRLSSRTRKQLAKIDEVRRDGFELDGVRQRVSPSHVILIDEEADGATSLAALMTRGQGRLAAVQAEIERRVGGIGRDALATIVYTSGTTGPPKGVLQTHGNHLATVEALMRLDIARRGRRRLLLPAARAFVRAPDRVLRGRGGNDDRVRARASTRWQRTCASARPHLVPAVPRIYEKIYARIQRRARRGGPAPPCRSSTGRSAWAAQRTRHARGGARRCRRCCAPRTRSRIASSSRASTQLLGGNIRYLISGGAPLAREIAEFFHAVGPADPRGLRPHRDDARASP